MHPYGYGLKILNHPSSRLTPPARIGPAALTALKQQFIALVPAYAGSLRGQVNPYFKMLLSRRKTLKMGSLPYFFGIYTAHASRSLWLAIDLVYTAVSQHKRVLFISDVETEKQLGIQSLNCMLYDFRLHSVLDTLSCITFYYTSPERIFIPLGDPADRYFDLVIVCLEDYSRLNRTTFRSFARFTLGFCSATMRPDLFDYYVPSMGTYQASVQLLGDVAMLGYLAR